MLKVKVKYSNPWNGLYPEWWSLGSNLTSLFNMSHQVHKSLSLSVDSISLMLQWLNSPSKYSCLFITILHNPLSFLSRRYSRPCSAHISPLFSICSVAPRHLQINCRFWYLVTSRVDYIPVCLHPRPSIWGLQMATSKNGF